MTVFIVWNVGPYGYKRDFLDIFASRESAERYVNGEPEYEIEEYKVSE